MKARRPHPEEISAARRDHRAYKQHDPQNVRYALANFEQTQRPLLVEILDERQALGVDLVLGTSLGVEAHDAPPKLVGDLRRTLARPAPRHHGPSLLHLGPGVRLSQALYLLPLGPGEPLG